MGTALKRPRVFVGLVIGTLGVGLTLGAVGGSALTDVKLGAAPTRTPPPRQTTVEWRRLLSDGELESRLLAVSPRWPEDGTIVVAGSGGISRTRDAGTTWETLPGLWRSDPGQSASAHDVSEPLVIAPAGPGATVLFLNLSVEGLFRSSDFGASWQRVESGGSAFAVSPDFERDGTAYLSTDTSLRANPLVRTTDRGATWQPVVTAGLTNRVTQISIPPGFSDHRTIFVVTSTSRDGSVPGARAFVSRDGGTTWSPISTPDAEGRPYADVERLVVSPDFRNDATLFLVSQGPSETVTRGGRTIRLPHSGVFRSVDGGAEWAIATGQGPWTSLSHGHCPSKLVKPSPSRLLKNDLLG